MKLRHRLSIDFADVQILDNITGFRELGNMMKYGLMAIYQVQNNICHDRKIRSNDFPCRL